MEINCTHIFICVNQKIQKKCCAEANAEEIFLYFKEALQKALPQLNAKERYKVVKTSCLGHCAVGPNIYIVPDGIWYTYSSTTDIDRIIQQHLIEKKPVEDLINRNICTSK
mgnify:CR=1 FL=1